VSAIYPGILFVMTCLVWFLTAWQSSRVLWIFRERHPQVAQREIPYVFDNWLHPEKVLFFFRRRASQILRGDLEVWRERQRFMVLALLSVVVPLLGSLTIIVYGILMSRG
jgi:hypothetical protein